MKTLLKILVSFSIAAILTFVVIWSDSSEILIQSEESQTIDGKSVFNKIKWISTSERDIWMMNQSHDGPHANSGQWERLAIVVDKTKTPRTARFYQLEPGVLEWSDNLKRIEFRVSCFMCHNNGPRAIRPLMDESATVKPGFIDRLRIEFWNLRVKSYGRIIFDPEHDREDPSLKIHFRWHGDYDNQQLKVKACVQCHGEEGFFRRGLLKRQQRATIQFMVQSGAMPPPGYTLSADEKRELNRFLMGFE